MRTLRTSSHLRIAAVIAAFLLASMLLACEQTGTTQQGAAKATEAQSTQQSEEQQSRGEASPTATSIPATLVPGSPTVETVSFLVAPGKYNTVFSGALTRKCGTLNTSYEREVLIQVQGSRTDTARSTLVFWEGLTARYGTIDNATGEFEIENGLYTGTLTPELRVTITHNVTGPDCIGIYAVNVVPKDANTQDAQVRVVGSTASLTYTLLEPTLDPTLVSAEYSVDGGKTYRNATPLSRSETAQKSPEPGTGTFQWNVAADLGSEAVESVLVRFVPEKAVEPQPVEGSTFAYFPLKNEVAEVCEIPDSSWSLGAEASQSLQSELSECLGRYVGSLIVDMDSLLTVQDASGARLKSTEGLGEVTVSVGDELGRYTTVTRDSLSRSQDLGVEMTAQQFEEEIDKWEQKLSSIGDDAQLANIDLQNQLQKQQQTLQTISNVSKMLHDTAMAVIRKIG